MLIPTSLIFWLSVWQFKARAHEQLKDVVCHPAGLVGGGCETWSTVAVSGPCGERARPCPVYVVSGFRPDRHCGRCVNISAIRGSLHARIVGGAEGDAKTETYALEREAWNRLWGPGVSGDTCLGEHFRATVESAECVAAFECMVHEERDTCTNCEATTGCGARAEDPCVTSVQGEHCYGVKLSDSRELFLRTVDDPGRGRGPVRVGLSLYRRLLRPRAVPDACPSHAAPEWLPYTTYRCPSLHFEGEPRSLPPASVPSPHRSLAGESIHAIEVLSLTDIHPLWDHRFNSIIGAPDWSYANGHKYPTPHSGGPTADRSHIRWWTGDQFSFVYINYDLRPKVFTGYLNDDWTATERFNDFLSNVTEFKAVAGDATYSFSITIDERGFLIVYGNMNEFPFYMDTNHAHLPPEFKTANCLAWASINAGNPDTMHFIGDRTRVCPSTGGYKWVRFEHDRFGALYTLYRSIAGPLNHGDGTGERALSLARWRHDHVWHSFGAEHSPDGSVCVAAATADPPSESDFAGWDADVTWSHQGHMANPTAAAAAAAAGAAAARLDSSDDEYMEGGPQPSEPPRNHRGSKTCVPQTGLVASVVAKLDRNSRPRLTVESNLQPSSERSFMDVAQDIEEQKAPPKRRRHAAQPLSITSRLRTMRSPSWDASESDLAPEMENDSPR